MAITLLQELEDVEIPVEKNEMYELEEGEVLAHRNVARSLDDLLAGAHGGLDKAVERTASKYVELLIYTLKAGKMRDTAIVLAPLLETKNKSLLRRIVKAHVVHVVSYMLGLHRHSFDRTPIVRMSLRVLQHLENHGVLRGSEVACSAPHFCVAEFSQTLFDLTKHSDAQVRTLAATFQKLRFDMPRGHATHDACKGAQKAASKMGQHTERPISRSRINQATH